jgi:hypothetical protein
MIYVQTMNSIPPWPRVPRACRFVAAGDACLKVASIGEGFGLASAWEDFRCASEREDLEEAAGMPLKWTAEEGASGGEDFDDAAGMPLEWTAEEGASQDEDFGDGAAVRAGLIGASDKEGFCVASGGEVFLGGGIASAEEDFRAASDEEEGLWTAVSLMMALLDVVAASDEGGASGWLPRRGRAWDSVPPLRRRALWRRW